MASFQQSLIDALQLDKFPKLKSFVESTEMAPTEDVVGAADMPMPKTIDNETIQTNLNAFLSRKGSNKRLSVDGIIGTDTTSVIKDFQKAQGLEADGIVGSKTIAALYSMPSIGSSNVEVKTLEPSQVSDAPIEPPVSKGIMAKQEPTKEVTPAVMPEELSVEQIQGYLTIEGFDVGGVDGKMGPKTRRAIREFQKSKGLKADGIVGKNTIAALLSEPKEDPLADKRPKARPSLMSPDEEEEFDTSQSVSREGQISGEGALDQFASSSAPITSERLLDAFVNEDGEDVDTPTVGNTKSMLLNLGFLPKMIGSLLSPDVTNEVKNLNPVEKVKSLGYIKNQYANILTNPSTDSLARIGADIRDGRYGGYATNLDENNPDHAKTIEQFFREAIGKKDAKFNAREEAWCALFVDHILNQMDVDRLGSGQGADLYDRVRARAYEGYGEGILGKSPTAKEFNSNSKQGDIVVLKSSFKVVAKGNKKFYDKEGNVRLDNNGNPAKAIWISSNVMDKNKDGTYFTKDSSDDILQNELDTYTSGGYSIQPQYHVGFSMGKAKNGYVRMLGGNQQNQVNVRGDAYAVENIMAVRRITSDTIAQEIN